MNDSRTTTIQVPIHESKRLKLLAIERNTSMAALVTTAIAAYLKKEEDGGRIPEYILKAPK